MNNLISMCLTDVKQTLNSGQESGNNSSVINRRIALTGTREPSFLLFQCAIHYLKTGKHVVTIHLSHIIQTCFCSHTSSKTHIIDTNRRKSSLEFHACAPCFQISEKGVLESVSPILLSYIILSYVLI